MYHVKNMLFHPVRDRPSYIPLFWEQLVLLFILIVSFRPFLFVWPFVHSSGHLLGKSCPLGFPLILFLFYAVLIVCIPFPFGGCGRMWNSIVLLIIAFPSALVWATSWENLLMPNANNKGTDQSAHPRSLISAFVVRCPDRMIPLVSIIRNFNHYLVSLTAQTGLSLP